MLHLVPALLILLLQGPGGLEKLALDGRYAEAATLLRSMGIEESRGRQQASHHGLNNASPDVALSAIRSSSQEFGKLLAALAYLIGDVEVRPSSKPIQRIDESQDPPPQPHAIGTVHSGFIANSRTRDGPR